LGEIIAIVKHFKDEPLALLVVGVIVLLKAVELLAKYVPQFFTGNKTKAWQEFVSGKITEIEQKLDKLFNITSAHEYLLDKTSEGTLENQLFTKEFSAFVRLKAFRRLLAKKKNGRIGDCGFGLLLELKGRLEKQAKELWLDVLETELGFEIADKEYYKARLDEIDRRIFDGFM
jgi:hypothetical protein